MKKYNHKKIESKWQEWWEKDKVSKIDKDDQTKEKYYILDMFPYPSGEGLHLGHTESYAASDVFYRYKKMRGYNVLHPQGFDSFGLPTENYAIKTGIPPVKTTKKNIETYTKQMKLLGLAYDFDEKIDTSEPEYYKWTQWLFGEFYKNGLVYKKTSPINWCPSCQTGIANEQVLAGNCERCGAEIIQKEIPGWFFKITDFADDLINDLDKVDWPEHTKKNQINWIGKSEGAIIKFQISHPNGRSPVKGDNFQFPNEQKPNVIIVHGSNFKDNERRNEKDFVPQNERSWLPWTKKELEKKGIKTDIPLMPENWNPKYNQWKKEFEKLEINENSILIGHSLGTNFLVRWLGETNTKIKKLILVALVTGQETCNEWLNDFENFKTDYKIKNNIREIIIFVSDNDNDERLESARIYQKELGAELIELKGRGHFIEKHMGTKEFPELLDKILCSSASGLRESAVNTESIEVFTTRPDTLFGATYMVLAPEHKLIGELKESNLPAGRQVENWEEVEKYIKETQKKTEMERIEGKEKTGVEIKGIKAINPVNKEEIPIFIADYVLEGYGTGAIMAVPAHDTRDYEFADTFGLEIREVVKGGNIQILSTARTKKGDVEIFCEKGILVNSEKFDGMSSEEAKQKITEFARGKSASNYRLRDWSISRQRYWGCPIPIVYSPEGEANLIPGKYLPWKLPEDVDFVPTGKSPLAKSAELKKRTEEIFGKGWAPEYDTMDTFVDSSWYFLRYPDVHNSKEFCSEARQKHWLPVDLYIGGAEHTYMHLLFARFFVKAMKKIGLLDFGEPFLKLRHQGMVLDAQGRKMSKSKGNVINPDKLVEKFGADAVRIQILFAAPLADDIIWNEDNIVGVYRFLEKVWEIGAAGKNESSAAVKNILQKTIKKVGQDIENLKYNTAISEMMKFINAAKKSKISKADFEMFLKILAPFAPHLTEEIWENLGHKISIHLEKWPDYDEKLIKDKTHTIAVQINGKIRAEIEIEDGLSDEEVKEMALSDKRVQKWMDGKSSKKIIYIKNKILSIVV